MSQNVICVGIDVDDVRYHGSALEPEYCTIVLLRRPTRYEHWCNIRASAGGGAYAREQAATDRTRFRISPLQARTCSPTNATPRRPRQADRPPPQPDALRRMSEWRSIS